MIFKFKNVLYDSDKCSGEIYNGDGERRSHSKQGDLINGSPTKKGESVRVPETSDQVQVTNSSLWAEPSSCW